MSQHDELYIVDNLEKAITAVIEAMEWAARLHRWDRIAQLQSALRAVVEVHEIVTGEHRTSVAAGQ